MVEGCIRGRDASDGRRRWFPLGNWSGVGFPGGPWHVEVSVRADPVLEEVLPVVIADGLLMEEHLERVECSVIIADCHDELKAGFGTCPGMDWNARDAW